MCFPPEDSISRAATAVRSAERLSSMATRAFRDEAANLENTKTMLEQFIEQVDVDDP
jgi:hypothetical protein